MSGRHTTARGVGDDSGRQTEPSDDDQHELHVETNGRATKLGMGRAIGG